MGGEIGIQYNAALADVSALYGLTSVQDDVTIRDNVVLTDLAAQDLVNEIDTIGGSIRISGNN